MNQSTIDILLRIWVLVAISIGVATIFLGDLVLTTIGVVLIILGLISLMPALRGFVEPVSPQ